MAGFPTSGQLMSWVCIQDERLQRLHWAVGAPIHVEKNPNPTPEQVQTLQQEYIQALTRYVEVLILGHRLTITTDFGMSTKTSSHQIELATFDWWSKVKSATFMLQHPPMNHADIPRVFILTRETKQDFAFYMHNLGTLSVL